MKPEELIPALQTAQKNIKLGQGNVDVNSMRLSDLLHLISRTTPQALDPVGKITIDPLDVNSSFKTKTGDISLGLGDLGSREHSARWRNNDINYPNLASPANVISSLMHEVIHGTTNNTWPIMLFSAFPGLDQLNQQQKVIADLPRGYNAKHQLSPDEIPSNVMGYSFGRGVFPGEPVQRLYPMAYDPQAQGLAKLFENIQAGSVPFLGDEHFMRGLPFFEFPKSEKWQQLQKADQGWW